MEMLSSTLTAEFLSSPDKAKELFSKSCMTDTVTAEPLLSMYHATAFDGGAATAVPTSVQACRPKDKMDLKVAQCASSIFLSVCLCCALHRHVAKIHLERAIVALVFVPGTTSPDSTAMTMAVCQLLCSEHANHSRMHRAHNGGACGECHGAADSV